MLLTDEDRLAVVQTFGMEVSTDKGRFWAIFRKPYVGASVADLDVEERTPQITCRTIDYDRFGGPKGAAIQIGVDAYRVLRHEPDGTGMSVVFLTDGT